MLTLLRRVFFGVLKEPAHDGHGPVRDLNGREESGAGPIAALCVFLGVWTQPFLDSVRPDLRVVDGIAVEGGSGPTRLERRPSHGTRPLRRSSNREIKHRE